MIEVRSRIGALVLFSGLFSQNIFGIIVQEYSEDSNSEPDVDLENQYYNSKALKEDEPEAALASFQKVLDLENGEKGEWGFKALKQMIKINFKLGKYVEMMTRYKQLLTYIKSAVTRNHSEKSINSILDYISTSKNVSPKSLGFCGGIAIGFRGRCRWNCYKISMKLLWMLSRMPRTTGCGSRQTPNWANCTSIAMTSPNCRRSSSNCTSLVR